MDPGDGEKDDRKEVRGELELLRVAMAEKRKGRGEGRQQDSPASSSMG